LNIHEYQAKSILRNYGVSVPRGRLATSVDEALLAARELGGDVCVVKAQIHAGGRGKAGGVQLCRDAQQVRAVAESLLGHRLVTKQTGEAGKIVHQLYIEEGLKIACEYYLSLLVDREAEAVAFVVSAAGGMDIEEVAANAPENILTMLVQDVPEREQTMAMAAMLGLQGEQAEAFHELARQLYRVFTECDCSLLELNPLVLTGEGALMALDAKIAVDDNALYRQPDIAAMRDEREEDVKETEARQYGLNYIALDGNIGCMVNGAGLAMATMDIIQLKGARPANFLDVGGGVTVDAVSEAFRLLFSDAHVKAVLVNIFGGIVRCDIIADGLIEAIQTHPMQVPVIMRLVGTNEQEGQRIIRQAGLDVRWADDLDQAAEMAVAAAGGA